MKLERIAWEERETPEPEALEARLSRDGFAVHEWTDAPGADYPPHSHPHDESLWVVEGEIVFSAEGREFPLRAGDRLMLPAGTRHSARVGGAGARYLIGQRR